MRNNSSYSSCYSWLGETRKEQENKFLTTRLACYIGISCTHGLVQDANVLLQKKQSWFGFGTHFPMQPDDWRK